VSAEDPRSFEPTRSSSAVIRPAGALSISRRSRAFSVFQFRQDGASALGDVDSHGIPSARAVSLAQAANDFEMGMLEGSPDGSGVEVIQGGAAFEPQHLDDFDQRGQFARAA